MIESSASKFGFDLAGLGLGPTKPHDTFKHTPAISSR